MSVKVKIYIQNGEWKFVIEIFFQKKYISSLFLLIRSKRRKYHEFFSFCNSIINLNYYWNTLNIEDVQCISIEEKIFQILLSSAWNSESLKYRIINEQRDESFIYLFQKKRQIEFVLLINEIQLKNRFNLYK